MANPFYTASGTPGSGAPGASSPVRSEFTAIQAAFDKLPTTLTANAAVVVNAGGTALTVTTGTLTLGGNLNIAGNLTTAGAFTTTGAFNTTLAQQASVTLTLPAVTGTLATLAGTEALTNKTYNGNTWTAGTGALAIGAGKTLTANSTLTLAGTDGKTLTTTASLTLAGTDGKTLTVSNNVTLSGNDGSTIAFGAGGTVLYSGGALGTPSAGTLTSCTGLPAAGVVAGALATGMTATTQAQASNDTKLATNAYVDRVAVQQVVSTITGAVNTGTTVMPWDDTIPQNTEGDQYMSLSITPKSATSTLLIKVVFNFAINNANVVSAALFQDSTANALAAAASVPPNIGGSTGFSGQIIFQYLMTSGTTSATTFKVRAGTAGGGGTVTFNGASAARLFGGVMASSITIEEIGV